MPYFKHFISKIDVNDIKCNVHFILKLFYNFYLVLSVCINCNILYHKHICIPFYIIKYTFYIIIFRTTALLSQ